MGPSSAVLHAKGSWRLMVFYSNLRGVGLNREGRCAKLFSEVGKRRKLEFIFLFFGLRRCKLVYAVECQMSRSVNECVDCSMTIL